MFCTLPLWRVRGIWALVSGGGIGKKSVGLLTACLRACTGALSEACRARRGERFLSLPELGSGDVVVW